jgi:enediyne biosynthesis protein E4
LLFRNNANGTFTEVGDKAGLRHEGANVGMGLGVVVVDLDGDGRPDIYAVNDTTENFLYQNQGKRGKLLFKDVSLASGAAMGSSLRPDGSMGVDAADYDGSGRPSLWVTTFESQRHALYRNQSTGRLLSFRYETESAGIGVLGSTYVGFGTAFVDVDNDGWEDIVIAHGHVRRHPTRGPLRQKPVFFRNLGTKRFVNSTAQGGPYFQVPHQGRGLAVGDLDNDGRPDLVITHLNGPPTLLRNDPEGIDVPVHHWLGLELIGRKHRDIAGARITVEAGGHRLTRFAKGGGSYLSASDRRLLIGLAAGQRVERVTVRWPWGGEQQWQGLTVDHYWQLVEDEPAPRATCGNREQD